MSIRRLVSAAAVAAGLSVSPVSGQTAPAEHNVAVWPLPETLSPEGRALAGQMAAMPQPDPLPPLETQRQIIGGMQKAMGAELLKRYEVRVTESNIAGVPVRIVYPKGTAALGKGPVLLNLHGGGFQLDSGSLTETIPIAALTGLPVVSVLYRLAPEHPYPAALDDALAVYGALEKDRPADRIAAYGTSAGAILGGELIAALAARKKPMPAAFGFFSGTADLSTAGDSESWMPLPAKAQSVGEGLRDYIGTASLADPVLSPIHSDLSGFPPTLLVSSTRDFLLSQTAIFGRALLERDVDARLVVFDGLPHAFWAYMDIPESREANALMASFLKRELVLAK
jgi:monoterpene epsilon-lactone hydrolase